MLLVHATCVEIGAMAVLLRGPSSSGKSDLALRLIEGGARLVADDQVQLTPVRGELIASAPPGTTGKIEIRGLGIVDLDEASLSPRARVVLAADLGPSGAAARLPLPATCSYEGIDLPLIALAAFEASCPAKVRMALRVFGEGAREAGISRHA